MGWGWAGLAGVGGTGSVGGPFRPPFQASTRCGWVRTQRVPSVEISGLREKEDRAQRRKRIFATKKKLKRAVEVLKQEVQDWSGPFKAILDRMRHEQLNFAAKLPPTPTVYVEQQGVGEEPQEEVPVWQRRRGPARPKPPYPSTSSTSMPRRVRKRLGSPRSRRAQAAVRHSAATARAAHGKPRGLQKVGPRRRGLPDPDLQQRVLKSSVRGGGLPPEQDQHLLLEEDSFFSDLRIGHMRVRCVRVRLRKCAWAWTWGGG